ncbi:hypothetical protein J4225_04150 [Candidatus Pacearchaeota archaeon]|nr:hypothetical protein [Candidatus Pacearchaeota archaeon]
MVDKKTNNNSANMPKEEEIGYHKGALSTLVNERNGLLQMIQIVDSTIQAHLKRLEELGVKLQKK